MIKDNVISAFKTAPLFRLGRVNFCFVDYDKLYDYHSEVEEDQMFKHIFGHSLPSFMTYLYPINLQITPKGLYKAKEGYSRYGYLHDAESRHLILCKSNVKLVHPFEAINCRDRHKNTTEFNYLENGVCFSDIVCLSCGITLSSYENGGKFANQ